MPDAVPAMKCKWQRDEELDTPLHGWVPGAHHLGDMSGVQMPAEQRRDQVGEAEDVKTARQRRACDSIQRGQRPRQLGTVDGEVRRHWPVESLAR